MLSRARRALHTMRSVVQQATRDPVHEGPRQARWNGCHLYESRLRQSRTRQLIRDRLHSRPRSIHGLAHPPCGLSCPEETGGDRVDRNGPQPALPFTADGSKILDPGTQCFEQCRLDRPGEGSGRPCTDQASIHLSVRCGRAVHRRDTSRFDEIRVASGQCPTVQIDVRQRRTERCSGDELACNGR